MTSQPPVAPLRGMTLQHARRTSPYPWTWEIPAAIAAAVLLVMVLAVHLARAVANLWSTGTWQFTPRPSLFTSLPGILTGHAGAGLHSLSEHASSGQLLFWIVTFELVALVAVVLALRSGLRRWGPGRIHGMASPAEAETLLGLSRLRRNAAVIRPDLHRGPNR